MADEANDDHDHDRDDDEKRESGQLVKEAEGDASRERRIQNAFEVLYLSRVLGGKDGEVDNQLSELLAGLRKTADLDDADMERMKKSANEYWKRTYLLFGLLAPA